MDGRTCVVTSRLSAAWLLMAVACASSSPQSSVVGNDASSPGKGVADAGADAASDTAVPPPSRDGGADAGRDSAVDSSRIDASRTDASRGDVSVAPVPDGGVDAGPVGPLAPAMACEGTAAQVYAAPSPSLPPITDALRGDILACTNDGPLDTAAVQAQLTAEADTGVTAVTGVAIYRVQYRTTRANGSAAVSSARVYLPMIPISAMPPIVIAAHGTEGLAASCATSMSATSLRDLALPWASLGYPVIAPDYAGLGTPGVQGYTDNRDTARSVVDSVAALRKFVSTTLSQKVVVEGHSQGGGAGLALQALATQMGLQGTLAAVLAYAPEYYSHFDSLGFLGALESVAPSNPLTISTGITKCEVATTMEYQYFANYVPGGPPTAGFPAAKASSLQSSIDSLCTIPLGGAIQADAPYVSDWTDPTLRAELLACVHGGDAGVTGDGGASCTGPGLAFYQYLKQNILTPDALGAPVLLVQGLQDIVMPPDQEAACNVNVLKAGGVTPQVCTDATASHTDVVNRNIGFGMQWAQAILAGTTPPACAASALPACSAP